MSQNEFPYIKHLTLLFQIFPGARMDWMTLALCSSLLGLFIAWMLYPANSQTPPGKLLLIRFSIAISGLNSLYKNPVY